MVFVKTMPDDWRRPRLPVSGPSKSPRQPHVLINHSTHVAPKTLVGIRAPCSATCHNIVVTPRAAVFRSGLALRFPPLILGTKLETRPPLNQISEGARGLGSYVGIDPSLVGSLMRLRHDHDTTRHRYKGFTALICPHDHCCIEASAPFWTGIPFVVKEYPCIFSITLTQYHVYT